MQYARILPWSALLAAITPLVLRAQAATGPRCEDGTAARPGYTACWFHGGLATAPSPAAAPARAATPAAVARSSQPAERPPAATRCKDGTVSEPGITACWFRGGVAPQPAPATGTSAKKPTPARAKAKAKPAAGKPKAKPAVAAKPAKPTKPPKPAAAGGDKAKPARAAKAPAGATARCKDGTYTTAKRPKKGCKSHGGVARLLDTSRRPK